MRLPFGLDLKTMIVTLIVAYFLVPWVLGRMSAGKSSKSS